MTEEVFTGGIALLRSLREDLPDGMWGSVEEQWEEIRSMKKRGVYVDWAWEAQQITELCDVYGLPSVFGDGRWR